MNSREFNEKYQDFLEERHYGCALVQQKQIEYLDKVFQDFILIPGFSYSQIKAKFGSYRFYCKGLSEEVCYKVEEDLKELQV